MHQFMSNRKHQFQSRGFTLVEVLTVCAISSLLLVLLASLFSTGMWEVGRSSGRIELVRRGRQTINNMQRYLSGIVESQSLTPFKLEERAIYTPDDDELYDPLDATPQPPIDRVRFFSPNDYLVSPVASPTPMGRTLQATPNDLAYEIVSIPGSTVDGKVLGQDIVLRRLTAPTMSTYPITPDTSIKPRFLGRQLGFPDSAAPGGFRDALNVRRLRAGALQIEIGLSSVLVTDDLNREQLESRTPLRIVMRTIYQPPYFNLKN